LHIDGEQRKQRKEALKREQEKLAKQEEFRRQTEKLLEAQQEVHTFICTRKSRFYMLIGVSKPH
jgi:hypothetical protein